jgi:hypothetical protein
MMDAEMTTLTAVATLATVIELENLSRMMISVYPAVSRCSGIPQPQPIAG